MKRFVPKHHSGSRPEAKIQCKLIDYLKARDWFVKVLHGNLYQSGMPDLFCAHMSYGIRLIECKDPNRRGDVFTAAQHVTFHELAAHGVSVFVLTGADKANYDRLFSAPNWYQYLGVMK